MLKIKILTPANHFILNHYALRDHSFTRPSTQPFYKYLLSTCLTPGTGLGAGSTVRTRQAWPLVTKELSVYGDRKNIKIN